MALVRPFEYADREQLTGLVNTHVSAVIPGVEVPVERVVAQLHKEPAEIITDPWVAERECLVAVERDAVVAGALLHRYRGDDDVNESWRNAGDIRWLVCSISSVDAGAQLLSGCLEQFERWDVATRYADGTVPCPGCYGVPSTWPHIRALYEDAGFVGPDHTEQIFAARCEDLLGHELPGTRVERTIGMFGARFELYDADERIGYFDLGELFADGTWCDVGGVYVDDDLDNALAIRSALYSTAAEWLLLGGVERLLDYYSADVLSPMYLETLVSLGFTKLVENDRGWRMPAD